MNELPDWKLPSGISQSLWRYLQSAELASAYDDRLAGTPLTTHDLTVARQFLGECRIIVDLGCGTGRLLTHLASADRQLVGVDLSWPMLQTAEKKLRNLVGTTTLLRMNLVEMDGFHAAIFDGAACLFSTLGMILQPSHRRQVVAHVQRILKPGGKFLLHAHNVWFHLRSPVGRRWLLQDRWRRLRGNDDFGNYLPPVLRAEAPMLHHFSRRELLRLLCAAGFRVLFTQSLSLRPDCTLPWPWLFPGLRAYGFLIGAVKL